MLKSHSSPLNAKTRLRSKQKQLHKISTIINPLLTQQQRSFSKYEKKHDKHKAISVVLTPDPEFSMLASQPKFPKRSNNSSVRFGQGDTNTKQRHNEKSNDKHNKMNNNTTTNNTTNDKKQHQSSNQQKSQQHEQTPYGKRNHQFGTSHRLEKLNDKVHHQKHKKQFTLTSKHDSNRYETNLLESSSHQRYSKHNYDKYDKNDKYRSNSSPQRHNDPNHPLHAQNMNLLTRKEKEDAIISKLEQFNHELVLLENRLSAPIQDVLLHNYGTIQRMALKARDSEVSGRNSHKSKNKLASDSVQLLENVAGAFHALDSALQGKTGIEAVKGTILEGAVGYRGTTDASKDEIGNLKSVHHDDNLTGWSLPEVDGVPKHLSLIYSSQPKIDPKTLPTYLQQIIFTNNKRLLQSQAIANQLLTSDKAAQKLLNNDHAPGVYYGMDENGNELKIEKLEPKSSKQRETELIIHGLHPTGAVSVRVNNTTNELVEMVSLADNLPIVDAFLPPNTSLSIPSELMADGSSDKNGGFKKDTLMAVSVSVKALQKQFEKTHIEQYKKEYYQCIQKYGHKDGEKRFWQQYPLNRKSLIPKENEIHAKYMTLLTQQHSLIKDIVSTTGYGHIQQVETREALISNLLSDVDNIDDYELLLLLKQSNIIHNDIMELNELSLVQPTTGDILTGKDALHGVLQHISNPDLKKSEINQLLDKECNWLNSRQSIILPYSSPDGFSDAHLPTLLRSSLKSIETAFASMRQSCTPSATAYTNMLSLYGQLGLPARAATLFDEMIHDSDTNPDTTTYNVMLQILSKDGKTDLCLQLFERMREDAIAHAGFGQADKYQTYQSVKHIQGRKVTKLKSLIAHKAKAMGIDDVDFSGLVELVKDDPTFKGTYLQGFEEKNKPSMDLIPKPDVVTYTTVLKALGKARLKSAALKLFDQMRKKDGIIPNEFTWTTMIDIACDSNDFMSGLRLFHEMKLSGVKPSRATYSAMTTSAARGGEIALTSALLAEMVQQQNKNIQLYQSNQPTHKGFGTQSHSPLLIDAHFIGSVMRASAEGGQASFALKLHSQLMKGQITGSGTIINPRYKGTNPNNPNALQNQKLSQEDKNKAIDTDDISNRMPNAITYNALLEVLADPASWGRTSLPPMALKIGLAVYQEALINNIFKHPYSEVQSTGVIDLRPYTRNAVMFPIHFFLNSLLGEVPVYTIDGIMPSKLNQSIHTQQFVHANTTENLDIAVQSITHRKASSALLGQNPYSIIEPTTTTTTDPSNKNEATQGQQVNGGILTNWSTPLETVKFPKLTIPPKGVVFVCNKEVKPSWTAAPLAANNTLAATQRDIKNQKYYPSIEFTENVLKHTKPWLHFTRLHYGSAEREGGANTKKKTANNPNAVVVTANALRLWIHEQTRELHKDTNQNGQDKKGDENGLEHLSKRQQRKVREALNKQSNMNRTIMIDDTIGDDKVKNNTLEDKNDEEIDYDTRVEDFDHLGTTNNIGTIHQHFHSKTTPINKNISDNNNTHIESSNINIQSKHGSQQQHSQEHNDITTSVVTTQKPIPKRSTKHQGSRSAYNSLPIQDEDGDIITPALSTTKVVDDNNNINNNNSNINNSKKSKTNNKVVIKVLTPPTPDDNDDYIEFAPSKSRRRGSPKH